MADNLSPLVNLDLINQIYKTINAQITERVYDPQYNSEATLGSKNNRYKSAYLKALDVNGDTTISGKVSSTEGFDGSLIVNGDKDYIKFAHYSDAESSTVTTTKTYTFATTLNNETTEIPTSGAVYAVIGDLETLLSEI